MVICSNKEARLKTLIDNGNVTVDCDVPVSSGGEGYVFGPHDFVEAGIAACMNCGVRERCEGRGVIYDKVYVKVDLNHDDDTTTFITCTIDITGTVEEQADLVREIKEEAFANCTVKKTLSKVMNFRLAE